MNSSLLSSPQPSEQLQQIIKLKVQLTKHKSRIEGYKQMQTNYKRLTIKAQAMDKQLNQYHKIMETFFQKLKRLMGLLDIDYAAIFGLGDDKKLFMHEEQEERRAFGDDNNRLDDSVSFINLNLNHNSSNNTNTNYSHITPTYSPFLSSNPTLLRRINKLNSLKSISHTVTPIEFTHEDAKFHLIESSIKSILQSNLQYKTTLQKYEQSSGNIEMSLKEQEIIVKRLQAQVRMREKELGDREQEVDGLRVKVEELMGEIKDREEVIRKLEKENESMVKMYQQLQGRISQLKSENSHQQQKKQQALSNCMNLLQQLKQADSTFLTHYLQQYLKHSPSHKPSSSPLTYSFNMISHEKRNQVYSESAGKINRQMGRNKYDLVFQ